MIDVCDQQAATLQTLQEALTQIKNSLDSVSGSETITPRSVLGRILSENVCSPHHLPNDSNASMDGYAFNSSDIKASGSFRLTCCGTSWAGKPYSGRLEPGCCIRIFTGAVIPDGADTVVIQEQVNVLDQTVSFPAGIEPKENIRYAGEDVKKGDVLLVKGKKITAVDLGLLAAAGIYQLHVYRKLTIGYLSTGDELVAIGQPLETGQLYDSNRYSLSGLLHDPAYAVTDLGTCGDDKQALKQLLSEAAKAFDVIITTGGASVGEADFIKDILDEIGCVNFWKIAMKPGKPLAFGHIDQACFFGLPGNPVSVIATFQQIVVPALRQLSGANPVQPLRFTAKCISGLKKVPGRLEFQRGILTQQANGEFEVKSAGKQGSHILSSISRANCYIVLPAECQGIQASEPVIVEPFERFL